MACKCTTWRMNRDWWGREYVRSCKIGKRRFMGIVSRSSTFRDAGPDKVAGYVDGSMTFVNTSVRTFEDGRTMMDEWLMDKCFAAWAGVGGLRKCPRKRSRRK